MHTSTTTLIALAMTPVGLTGSDFGLSQRAAPVRADTRTDIVLRRQETLTEWNVVTSEGDTPIEQLRQKVQEYANLSDGWDGPGSIHASSQSRDAALGFIDQIPIGIPVPGIMISSQGEIGFYWDFAGGNADISFTESGAASFFARSGQSHEIYVEHLKTSDFSRQWFFANLGAIAAPDRIAA